jgi:hypothetical protein
LQGITTYDYILAVREQEEHAWEDSGLAQALHHGVFCTPPRVFVEQDQVLSSLVLCGFTD